MSKTTITVSGASEPFRLGEYLAVTSAAGKKKRPLRIIACNGHTATVRQAHRLAGVEFARRAWENLVVFPLARVRIKIRSEAP